MANILRLLVCLLLALAVLPRSARAAYYPAAPACSLELSINQTASTDLHTFTNNANICYVLIVNGSTAQNVSLVQGTGTTCGTSTVALIGGTTASVALPANGGFSLSIPTGSTLKTTTTGQHLCLLQSGSSNVSGVIGYYDAP